MVERFVHITADDIRRLTENDDCRMSEPDLCRFPDQIIMNCFSFSINLIKKYTRSGLLTADQSILRQPSLLRQHNQT